LRRAQCGVAKSSANLLDLAIQQSKSELIKNLLSGGCGAAVFQLIYELTRISKKTQTTFQPCRR
jgi:hypothetical protein